eukprot:461475_1
MSVDDSNKWLCTACTFRNLSRTDRCEVCSAKRHVEQQQGSGFDNINLLEQIILQSTHEHIQDCNTMDTLIMTHIMFTDSLTLMKQLRNRFFVPIPPDIWKYTDTQQIKQFQLNVQKIIQLKVIKALRDWM